MEEQEEEKMNKIEEQDMGETIELLDTQEVESRSLKRGSKTFS